MSLMSWLSMMLSSKVLTDTNNQMFSIVVAQVESECKRAGLGS